MVSVALVLFLFDDISLLFFCALESFDLLLGVQLSQFSESLDRCVIHLLSVDNVLIQRIEFVHVEGFVVF